MSGSIDINKKREVNRTDDIINDVKFGGSVLFMYYELWISN